MELQLIQIHKYFLNSVIIKLQKKQYEMRMEWFCMTECEIYSAEFNFYAPPFFVQLREKELFC